MKDYLQSSRWVNMAPRNPTQTKYTRFFNTPHGELTSSFTDSVKAWHDIEKKYKTVYDKYIGDLQ